MSSDRMPVLAEFARITLEAIKAAPTETRKKKGSTSGETIETKGKGEYTSEQRKAIRNLAMANPWILDVSTDEDSVFEVPEGGREYMDQIKELKRQIAVLYKDLEKAVPGYKNNQKVSDAATEVVLAGLRAMTQQKVPSTLQAACELILKKAESNGSDDDDDEEETAE